VEQQKKGNMKLALVEPLPDELGPDGEPQGFGEPFGKYRLVGAISSGGMAELFLGLQAGMEGFTKVCAIKRILPHMARSAEFINMFLDEARLAARLDHPNIVRIYELGEIDGRYFMAMEYLPGEDLGRVIRMANKLGKTIDADIAAAIIQAAADGLNFAHELRDPNGKSVELVHRDVNPYNILVTYHGHVKVVDFGIAKASTNTSATQAGVLKGKLAYLAPEQVRGEPLDRRCDVFCLGIVMWELLTGQRLFMRSSDPATLAAVQRAEIPSIRNYRRSIDPELEAICMKALTRDPDDRYQTASELHDALDHYFMTRTTRPSAKHLAQWLEKLFGEARANAKRSIAQGTNLKTSISEVMAAVRATRSAIRINPKSGSAPTSDSDIAQQEVTQASLFALNRRGLTFYSFVAFSVLAIAVGTLVSNGSLSNRGAPTEVVQTATLVIESDPPGAAIFVNGEPSGRMTPAKLGSLKPEQKYLVRLEKQGYVAVRENLVPSVSDPRPKRFTLKPLQGTVRLEGVASDAKVLVDGQRADSNQELELSIGRHYVQIVQDGRIVKSKPVDVEPGEQTLRFGD